MLTTDTHQYRVETKPATSASRTVETRYVIENQTGTSRRGETVHAALVVRAFDSADNRQTYVTVDRQTQAGIWVRQVIDFRRDAPDYVKALSFRQPRARYNQKAMVALHEEVVRDLIEPQLERLLDWAVGALDLED